MINVIGFANSNLMSFRRFNDNPSWRPELFLEFKLCIIFSVSTSLMFLNVSLLVGGFFRYSLNDLFLDCFIEFERDFLAMKILRLSIMFNVRKFILYW